MKKQQDLCKFTDQQGVGCSENDIGRGYCFWHDPEVDKSGLDTCRTLERYIKRGANSRGLQLKRARLENIDLVNRGSHSGFNLQQADLYRANLKGAHLFNIDLRGSSLMKADLSGANLHCAKLQECNLLGIRLKNARLDNIQLGDRLLQEKNAARMLASGDPDQAREQFKQAEEIYRDLRKAAESQGLFELGGRCMHKELIMRRYQQPKFSSRRIISKFIDLFCGYGEKPFNVVLFALLLIAVCAVMYFLLGLSHKGELLIFTPQTMDMQEVNSFLSCLYFSVVTFTTLGYGDITPVGLSRIVAAFEAFTGSFTIALFVVVFVKKMTR